MVRKCSSPKKVGARVDKWGSATQVPIRSPRMVYILQEDETRTIWNIQAEGHSTFAGALHKLENGRFCLKRFQYGEVETIGNEVPRMLKSFFPEAERFDMIKKDGARRPVKGQ